MSEPRATAHGKQVKLDGEHFADAIGDAAAQVIADCINNAGWEDRLWPEDARQRVESYFA